MKANELRIGNLVKSFSYDEPIEVHSVCNVVNDIFNRTTGEIPIDTILPIPLTEEWLLKFHPNALDLSNQIFRVGRFKLIWKFAYNYWYIVDDITGCYMTKLDFVHEWQNFWHIMNGEELTLKK